MHTISSLPRSCCGHSRVTSQASHHQPRPRTKDPPLQNDSLKSRFISCQSLLPVTYANIKEVRGDQKLFKDFNVHHNSL